MGYSTGNFSEISPFLKMTITQKIELGISSNFLCSIRTPTCIRKMSEGLNYNVKLFILSFLFDGSDALAILQ